MLSLQYCSYSKLSNNETLHNLSDRSITKSRCSYTAYRVIKLGISKNFFNGRFRLSLLFKVLVHAKSLKITVHHRLSFFSPGKNPWFLLKGYPQRCHGLLWACTEEAWLRVTAGWVWRAEPGCMVR